MKDLFDLIVLGAGSGGLAAAKRAAKHGARVAVIEADRVGGTCVIRGCVPKKLMVYGSLYRKYLECGPSYGVQFEDASIDAGVLLKNVRKEVDRLNKLHIDLLEKAGVKLIKGWGSFIGANTVSVKGNKESDKSFEIKASRILIAVGGRPNRPDIPGATLGWVSDDMFLQENFPRDVVVVGAGFIACEFSCILHGLGVKVIQLVRGDQLLRGFDKDLSKRLEESMQENGIELRFGQSPEFVEGVPGELLLGTSNGEQVNCGGILFATGRSPFLQNLNLDSAGIKVVGDRIPVDINNNTNISNIYAVGDVTNRFNLTPVAIDEGRAFADTVFGNKPRNVNYDLIPYAVFSQPEIATIGFTEEQSIDRFGSDQVKVYSTRFRSMSQALSEINSFCFLKLIVKGDDEKVIGCHMVGENAAEIIQMASVSLGMGATKSDFDRTMALHPTIAEEFVTMA